MRKNTNTNKITVLGILDVLTVLCLFFTNWVGYQYKGWFVNEKESFALWKAADFLSEASYIHYSIAAYESLAIFIYIILGLSILSMIYTAYNLCQNYNSGVPIQTAGFMFPGILSVFVILLVTIENDHIGMDLFYLTAVPFLVLVIAIVALLVDRQMPDTLPTGG